MRDTAVGVGRTVYDASTVVTYGVTTWVAPEQTAKAYGPSVERMDQLLNGFTGGRGNSGAYRVTSTLFNSTAMVLSGEAGAVSRLGRAGAVGETVVATERAVAAGEGRFVYRGLAQGEDAASGLIARVPGAGNTPISHVAGQRASEWISTTKSEAIALEKFSENGVVRIDLNKVTSPTLDVSGGFPGKPGMISNWAIKDQELLIKNSVPAEAITRVR
jgi:hypothetical protein